AASWPAREGTHDRLAAAQQRRHRVGGRRDLRGPQRDDQGARGFPRRPAREPRQNRRRGRVAAQMIGAIKRPGGGQTPDDAKAPPLVALAGVSRSFDDGAIVALKSVDLAIEAGECVAVLGPSGSGKSSIVNLLSGIDRPSGGDVLWNGKPVVSRRA